jgi:hypothetical protein
MSPISVNTESILQIVGLRGELRSIEACRTCAPSRSSGPTGATYSAARRRLGATGARQVSRPPGGFVRPQTSPNNEIPGGSALLAVGVDTVMSSDAGAARSIDLRDALEQAVHRVLARRLTELRAAAETYISVEDRWLHRDLLEELRQRPGIKVTSKVPIAGNSTKYVDVVITDGEVRLLVELKVFVTNYGHAGRPVTNQRNAIRLDLLALGERMDQHTDGCVLWLAYPIPSDREGDWRVNHLRLIERASKATVLVGAPINVGQGYVRVYLIEASPSR